MKTGDLVIWPEGQAVQVMFPDLGNAVGWFHECELVKVS